MGRRVLDLLKCNVAKESKLSFYQFQETVVASVPIAHWYVEPWQEVLIRHTDRNCRWVDGETVDVVNIQDGGDTVWHSVVI